jgi:outer membrane protein assembly factor BamB
VLLAGGVGALVAVDQTSGGEATPEAIAQQIHQATGVRSGLIVHVGCGEGRLTAALRAGEGTLVHGLDRNPAQVAAARQHLRQRGVYGPVAVEHLSSNCLPYTENMVNLLVVEEPADLAEAEMLRVLCPQGVAYVKRGGQWTKTVKPRPPEMDEWTHYLHGPNNNAVSQDSLVGPPRHLQWMAGPVWTRSHDHLASVSVAVSSGGRLFAIVDEGPISFVALPARWQLVARDAFNGKLLWKRAMGRWEPHLRGFRSGPTHLQRRLLADKDRVFVTLGYGEPVVVLDAATGETKHTYHETRTAYEMVLYDGALLVVAGERNTSEEKTDELENWRYWPQYVSRGARTILMAIAVDSGKVLWKKTDVDAAEIMPTTLAAAAGRVFFQTTGEVICLDARTGEERWRAARPVALERPAWSAPTLVVYGDVVLSADRKAPDTLPDGPRPRTVRWIGTSQGGQAPPGTLIAFSAKDGKRLWESPCRECYNAPVDVLVAGGLIWSGDLVTARDPGITVGLDPLTGKVERTRPKDQEFYQPGMSHHRCYRNKATEKYIITGRAGAEFLDIATGEAFPHHWIRGTCQYGIMPANGLLYVPPHSCACFIEAKLNSFLAVSAQRPTVAAAHPEATISKGSDNRWESGSAIISTPAVAAAEKSLASLAAVTVGGDGSSLEEGAAASRGAPVADDAADWPTYRGDAGRSGRARFPVPTDLHIAWQTPLGGRLSSLVVAEGVVFVAQVDTHTLYALGASDGRTVWSFTAGGRIDSPPTVFGRRVLFGSADGWIYCLRAGDGQLVWRYRAAPQDRRLVAYEQVESVWPVSGSVLVLDGVAYAAAGRSSYLDGGIRLVRLDALTGKPLSETVLDSRDPRSGQQPRDAVRGFEMPGALPDVLSSDGEFVYMRHLRFDREGQPLEPTVPHLFSAAGFLDDTWWHRSYWLFGARMRAGWGGWPVMGNLVPSGRILSYDESTVYGFGRTPYERHGSHVGLGLTHYRLFAALRPDVEAPAASEEQTEGGKGASVGKEQATGGELIPVAFFAQPRQRAGAKKAEGVKPADTPVEKPQPTAGATPGQFRSVVRYHWTREIPLLVRAMVLAERTLFVAGPPDSAQPAERLAAWENKLGGRLWAVSTVTGETLAEHTLPAVPVFDGMAAARGCLYLSSVDGSVACLRKCSD